MIDAATFAMPPARYLALGDSYTIGEGVGFADRWPVRLVGELRAAGIELADPKFIARTGWTTDELSAAIDAEQLDGASTFDLVTLLIGVNNQYRGRPLDEYREQFTALLERSIRLAGDRSGRVIVVSIPDWGATPFARDRDTLKITRDIDAFNTVNREQAARLGARYVDVTPVSRTEFTLLADDGLHPSGEMYARWASVVLPEAVAALTDSPRA